MAAHLCISKLFMLTACLLNEALVLECLLNVITYTGWISERVTVESIARHGICRVFAFSFQWVLFSIFKSHINLSNNCMYETTVSLLKTFVLLLGSET